MQKENRYNNLTDMRRHRLPHSLMSRLPVGQVPGANNCNSAHLHRYNCRMTSLQQQRTAQWSNSNHHIHRATTLPDMSRKVTVTLHTWPLCDDMLELSWSGAITRCLSLSMNAKLESHLKNLPIANCYHGPPLWTETPKPDTRHQYTQHTTNCILLLAGTKVLCNVVKATVMQLDGLACD